MSFTRYSSTAIALLFSAFTLAQAPAMEAPLPPLTIEERGEILLDGEEFSFAPWTSAKGPERVQILQYIGATKKDSKLFKPLTDSLQTTFEPGSYHVTTIINLDAALWGTTGLVVSEIKKNKRKHPKSTLVLDENGAGARSWELGDKGAGMMIVDASGIVRYFARGALNGEQLERSLELVREQIEACTISC